MIDVYLVVRETIASWTESSNTALDQLSLFWKKMAALFEQLSTISSKYF